MESIHAEMVRENTMLHVKVKEKQSAEDRHDSATKLIVKGTRKLFATRAQLSQFRKLISAVYDGDDISLIEFLRANVEQNEARAGVEENAFRKELALV